MGTFPITAAAAVIGNVPISMLPFLHMRLEGSLVPVLNLRNGG